MASRLNLWIKLFDDAHNYHVIRSKNSSNGTWLGLMVLAEDLSQGSLIEAMEKRFLC